MIEEFELQKGDSDCTIIKSIDGNSEDEGKDKLFLDTIQCRFIKAQRQIRISNLIADETIIKKGTAISFKIKKYQKIRNPGTLRALA